MTQPRIRHNDYGVLAPPAPGDWRPSLTVSVVIAAYGHQDKLDLTLAALAAQSYPAELTEVVVVDDGSVPALRLPEIVPANTRLLTTEPGSRGRSNARNAGLAVAGGDVVHWLDADMVTFHDEVEAHMRWHHVAGYLVVMGYVRYVEHRPGSPTPAEVHAAVSAGAADTLFDEEASEPHSWIVDLAERTDGLRTAGDTAYRVHVTNAASVNTRLLRRAGPLDTGLVLGEDTELGYRLAQAGAAFVLAPEARSRHLGASMMMRDKERVKRYNHAFVPGHIPHMRWLRTHPGRQWLVPYAEVVVEAGGASYESVRATVDGFLAGTLNDIQITLVGAWDAVREDRRNPLDSSRLDLLLLRGLYRGEHRVRWAEELAGTPSPAPYRLLCPPGWVPGPESLRRLVELAAERGFGLVSVALDETEDEVVAARLEHTASFARAAFVQAPGESRDAAVDDVAGTHWVDGRTYGFLPERDAEPPRRGRAGDPALRQEIVRLREENARLTERLAALGDPAPAGPPATTPATPPGPAAGSAARPTGPRALLRRLR
ncbi:glycosyltransferase family 2 protein [Sphaerisporangium sp. TRM90804]|uniref:glycosyltransferase family 2 protein n=1 Tax=Sphaerisporangium sp. TRM90804 TaxID=3031113 RepID=UPI002446EDA1|nr:glycosyltransferase family 2 protein [Sphaerisporangium sp. TRM90804]MDH2426640.1 glycosyltransferase [Sphaerisporangium sp. TRM90804]